MVDATLTAFFAAFANDAIDQGRISVEVNAACVHSCVPACSRHGLAHNFHECLVRCRDRCLAERHDETLHATSMLPTLSGDMAAAIAGVVVTVLVAAFVLNQSPVPWRVRLRRALNRKNDRFD